MSLSFRGYIKAVGRVRHPFVGWVAAERLKGEAFVCVGERSRGEPPAVEKRKC